MTDRAPAICCQSVSFGYRSANGVIDVLDSIGISVGPGEIMGFVGPSGCGKTTLLRLLGDLVHPDQVAYRRGSIAVLGKSPGEIRQARQIGVLFQNTSLFPWRNVVENVLLPAQIAGVDGTEAFDRATELLELVGLQDFRDSPVSELSGGMRQRVALVRALMNSPDVLLLDEPLASLDELVRDELIQLLQDIWMRLKPTIIVVSHDLSDTVILSDRVAVLSDRPARILDVVEVPLPRPRAFTARLDDRFTSALIQVREVLTKKQRDSSHANVSS